MMDYKKRKKPKYNLHKDETFNIECKPYGITIKDGALKGNKFMSFDQNGNLTIKQGYSWDGPSGPTIDTKNFMRGSLVHDALYQLMREQVIPQSKRLPADKLLRDICKKDGMWKIRAWWVYWGVRIAAKCAAKPDLLSAP